MHHSTNVAYHFNERHAGDPPAVLIKGVEKIEVPRRGCDKFKLLCKREVFWIFHLKLENPWDLIMNRMFRIFLNEYI